MKGLCSGLVVLFASWWGSAPAFADATIIELQPFRDQQQLTNARGDTVRLVNLNPHVGAWYVLDLDVGGRKNTLHLEAPVAADLTKTPAGSGPRLSLYRDGLLVSLPGGKVRPCALWAGAEVVLGDAVPFSVCPPALFQGLNPEAVLSAPLTPGLKFDGPFTLLCEGLILVRSQFKGSSTILETATQVLRETSVGSWLVEKVKPYLIEPPEIGQSESTREAQTPQDGAVFPPSTAPAPPAVFPPPSPPSGGDKGGGSTTSPPPAVGVMVPADGPPTDSPSHREPHQTAFMGAPGAAAPAVSGTDPRPRDAQIDSSKATLWSTRNRLGIKIEAPTVGPAKDAAQTQSTPHMYYGRWYAAASHPGVFVSVIMPSVVAPSILTTYPERVAKLQPGQESDALVYLAAFDLTQFRLGFAAGTENPGVGWANDSLRPRGASSGDAGAGPDRFGAKAPLVTIGTVPPYYLPSLAATFVGGFKRQHGVFWYGEFAKVNNHSHFGFVEQGTIFSTLQPGLATAYIGLDGSPDLLAWPAGPEATDLLANVRAARQNCLPLIESYDRTAGLSVPGAYVNNAGAGAWSANQRGEYVTIRAGIAIQDLTGARYLVFAYFTGATPNAMARVFQAYGCRFGMLLDMNSPNYGYLAIYNHDDAGNISGAEYLNCEMSAGNGGATKDHPNGALKFVDTNDNRDFFYVLRKP